MPLSGIFNVAFLTSFNAIRENKNLTEKKIQIYSIRKNLNLLPSRTKSLVRCLCWQGDGLPRTVGLTGDKHIRTIRTVSPGES